MEQITPSAVETTTEVTEQNVAQEVVATTTTETQNAPEVKTEVTSEQKTETSNEGTAEKVVTPQAETTTIVTPKKSVEELLAEHGYGDELEIIKKSKETIAKEIEETEKPFNETKAWADLIEFSAKNKLATQDDFIAHKEINKQSNETLAFNKFKSDYVPSELEKYLEPAELEEVIRSAYNEKFYIDSDNETLKKIGQQEISAIADSERKPINDKILTVQNRMLTSAMTQQHKIATEEFAKTAQKSTVEFTNEKGETVVVETESTPAVKFEEVAEFLNSEDGQPVLKVLFEAFRTNREAGDKAFGEFLTAKYSNQTIKETQSQIAKSSYEKGLEAGKALAVGSKNPFNSKENQINGINTQEEPVREYTSSKYSS